MKRLCSWNGVRGSIVGLFIVLGLGIGSWPVEASPVLVGRFGDRFTIEQVADGLVNPSQMTWGPDGRLYVGSSNNGFGVTSLAWNTTTGRFDDLRSSGVSGLGLAFHTADDGTEHLYTTAAPVSRRESRLARFSDLDGDGFWGELGETAFNLVDGIPGGDHQVNQIQIVDDTLYTGIGIRTMNGRDGLLSGGTIDDFGGSGFFAGGEGNTRGETSYGGSIAWIRDLNAVPDLDHAAQLTDADGNLLSGLDFLDDASPYLVDDPGRLTVHSGGTRNPFGLAVDESGALHFTNNYSRSNSNGDGSSEPNPRDQLDDDFSNDVHDQFFRAVEGGDYGYDNTGFRDPNSGDLPGLNLDVDSITFDNLDPLDTTWLERQQALQETSSEELVGLGPHSSSNGFDFATLNLTGIIGDGLEEFAFITRFTDDVSESGPGEDTLTFADLVLVQMSSGRVFQVAEGFDAPLDALKDGQGGLLVADWGAGSIYRLTPNSTVIPEPNGLGLLALGVGLIVIARRFPSP